MGGWATRRVGSLKSGILINIPQVKDHVRAYWHVSKGDLVNVVKSNYDYLVDLIVKSDTVDNASAYIERVSEDVLRELDILVQ
jgi:Holliday junction resolvase RusA-like endonuclease